MKNSIIVFLFLSSTIVYAQSDTIHKADFVPCRPLLTLTHDDIRNLPVSNFMELVNAAFPFLKGNPPMVSNYSFIVNGFVSIHPNAINISQIGRIDFYPNGIYENQGILTKEGCFVITLLENEVKNAFAFSTRTGRVFYNKEERPYLYLPGSGGNNFHADWFSLNELSYLNQDKRSTVNSSFSFTKDNKPFTEEGKDKYHFDFNRYRFSNYLSYAITDRLKISGNLLLAYFKESSSFHKDNSTGKGNSEGDINTKYGHASIAMDFSPISRFKNRFSIEGNLYNHKTLGRSVQTSPFAYTSIDSLHTNLHHFVITDQAGYNIFSTSETKLDAALLLRYLSFNDTTSELQATSNPPYSSLNWIRKSRYKYNTISASPGISMQWKNFLHLYAGGVLEKYSLGVNTPSQATFIFHPEFSLSAEFAGLIKQNTISSLNLFASYRNYVTQDEQKQDLLDVLVNAYSTFYYSSFNDADRVNAGLGLGFLKDKLNFRFSFLHDQKMARINGSLNQSFPLTRTAWSTEISAKIIEKDHLSWNVEALAMTDKYKFENGNSTKPENKRQWRNMIRTRAEFGNLFLQGSILLSVNDQHYDSTGAIRYHNDKDLNLLVIGYRLRLKNSFFSNIEFSAQSKNMILPKYPYTYGYLSRYLGIGITLSR